MRAMACTAAALMFAFTTACNDRDRQDTASRIDNAAEEAGQDVREGAEDVGDAAEDAVDDLDGYSYERRDEFRRDVRQRLNRMDQELAEFERDAKAGGDSARLDAVAAARDARQAVDRDLERLGDATAANWDELRHRVSEALDSAHRELRALQLRRQADGRYRRPGAEPRSRRPSGRQVAVVGEVAAPQQGQDVGRESGGIEGHGDLAPHVADHLAPHRNHGVGVETQLAGHVTAGGRRALRGRRGRSGVRSRSRPGAACWRRRRPGSTGSGRRGAPRRSWCHRTSAERSASIESRSGQASDARHQRQAGPVDPADGGVDHHVAAGPEMQHAGHLLTGLPDPPRRGRLDPKTAGCQISHRAAVALELEQRGSRSAVFGPRIAPAIELRLAPSIRSHVVYSPR